MKTVEIEMDKVRHLKFGMNALIELEQKTGKPLSQMGDVSMADLRTILWCGLIHEDKKLTESKVGDLMDEAIEKNGMEHLAQKIGEAMENSMGNAKLPSIK